MGRGGPGRAGPGRDIAINSEENIHHTMVFKGKKTCFVDQKKRVGALRETDKKSEEIPAKNPFFMLHFSD